MAEKSIFEYLIPPRYLGGGVIIGMIVFSVLSKIMSYMGLRMDDADTYWVIATSFTLLYTIFTSIACLPWDNQRKFLIEAIIVYAVILFLGGLIAYVFSGVSMDGVSGYRWLYIVFTISFVIFLGIARFVRRMVIITEKYDAKIQDQNNKV